MEKAVNVVNASKKEDLAGKKLACERIESVETKFGKKTLYYVKTEDGKDSAFFGTPVIDKQKIQIGDVFALRKIKSKKGTEYWVAMPFD